MDEQIKALTAEVLGLKACLVGVMQAGGKMDEQVAGGVIMQAQVRSDDAWDQEEIRSRAREVVHEVASHRVVKKDNPENGWTNPGVNHG